MLEKNPVLPKNGFGSGGRTLCPKRPSFSQFVVLMRTTNCEKDTLSGQRVLPPEPKPFFGRTGFFSLTLYIYVCVLLDFPIYIYIASGGLYSAQR